MITCYAFHFIDVKTFMGISFLGQGLSMATGGLISYLFDWRGVFAVYAVLSVIPVVSLFRHYKDIPSVKHEDSRFPAPYGRLFRNPASLLTYILVVPEGLFIVGGFSYLGTCIAATYHYNYLGPAVRDRSLRERRQAWRAVLWEL